MKEREDKRMKHYQIKDFDGLRYRIHVDGEAGVKELEQDGFWFDDFCDDGTGDEIWKAE